MQAVLAPVSMQHQQAVQPSSWRAEGTTAVGVGELQAAVLLHGGAGQRRVVPAAAIVGSHVLQHTQQQPSSPAQPSPAVAVAVAVAAQ